MCRGIRVYAPFIYRFVGLWVYHPLYSFMATIDNNGTYIPWIPSEKVYRAAGTYSVPGARWDGYNNLRRLSAVVYDSRREGCEFLSESPIFGFQEV